MEFKFEIDKMLRIPNTFKILWETYQLLLHGKQVAMVPILFGGALAMLQSMRTKNEIKRKKIVISSLMFLLE